MASVITEPDVLRIALTRGEKWAALRRSDLTVPWSEVRDIELSAEPFRLVHGLRAPGLALPWRTKIGTWRSKGRKAFAVTRKGAPGLRIRLRDNDYAEILLSVPDSAALVGQITAQLEPSLADPCSERLVAFPSGDVTLAGTVLLPGMGKAVRGAAVVITGSGALDRDGSERWVPIDVSREIAQSLAAPGIATLRYDKRGVGSSGGDFFSAGLWDNIDDARSAIETLAAQPECTEVPIFVIGHSEGAIIACALAGEPESTLAGVVLLAGFAKTGEQILLWQSARIAPTLPKAVILIMKMLRTNPAKQQRRFLERMASSTKDVERIQGTRINAKWFRELLVFDPVPHLAAVTVPVLAVTGEKDLQVDPDDLEVIAATVGGPVAIHRVPDLTHILRRDSGSPSLSAYRRLIKLPVDSAVLQEISTWIRTTAEGAQKGAGS